MADVGSFGYLVVVERSWKRMVRILFRPFDLVKWFALGFAAWLATLFGGSGGISFNMNFDGYRESYESLDMNSFSAELSALNAALVLAVLIPFLIFIIAVVLVVSWLRARGHFMFLNCVMDERVTVAEGWKKYRSQGNSLFLWNICFGLFSIVLFSMAILAVVFSAVALLGDGVWSGWGISVLVFGVCICALMFIVFSYISLFLNDFVTPIMRAHGLRVIPAWRYFLRIFRLHPLPFIVYGLFRSAIVIVVWMIVAALSLLTCCLLSCIMSIPYIRAVVLLPVLVFYRALGPEFLFQFDEDMTAD